ncbi:hypothetical protein P3T29_006210 [Kitasatospora sp. MAP5-34]|nr:hypothetical protein [Kitasatospora sp. MAP5-34]
MGSIAVEDAAGLAPAATAHRQRAEDFGSR